MSARDPSAFVSVDIVVRMSFTQPYSKDEKISNISASALREAHQKANAICNTEVFGAKFTVVSISDRARIEVK